MQYAGFRPTPAASICQISLLLSKLRLVWYEMVK